MPLLLPYVTDQVTLGRLCFCFCLANAVSKKSDEITRADPIAPPRGAVLIFFLPYMTCLCDLLMSCLVAQNRGFALQTATNHSRLQQIVAGWSGQSADAQRMLSGQSKDHRRLASRLQRTRTP